MTLAAILALTAQVLAIAIPIVTVAAPVVVPLMLSKISADKRKALVSAAKGATLVVGEMARRTPTTVDDNIAVVLRLVSDELGRPLTEPEVTHTASIAAAIHADPSINVKLGDGIAIAALQDIREKQILAGRKL